MMKESLQLAWWALVRGSRGPPSGTQGYTAPQFGKHCTMNMPSFGVPIFTYS